MFKMKITALLPLITIKGKIMGIYFSELKRY